MNDSDSDDESSEVECNNSTHCNLNFLGPEAQIKLAQLFEEAGLKHLSPDDGKGVTDPEILRQLTSSVNCALEEAVAALTLTRIKSGSSKGIQTPDDQANLDALHQRALESLEEGESLLSLACSSGYYELVQVLLAMNTNIEERGIKGDTTPLMEAASGGYMEIVKLLLEHDADPKAQSLSGNTALTYACIGGHCEVVRLLLSNGADVEHQNENGHTALMEAATGGHVDIARILVNEGGASINAHSNEFKESALTLACYKGNLEMVRFLLEAGADHEHKTEEMHTALMEASMDGHLEVAKLLLDHGAQVNMPPDSFESPLTLAACGGHVELACLLLERGANLEEINDEGYTPLMEAAREGHKDMVNLLINRGANVNAQTEETQETALTLACYGGFLQVADQLIKSGADIEIGCNTPLMESAQEGHLDLVHYLLLAGANPHGQTGPGNTALTFAAENGHTDIVALLLHYRAEIDHESEGGKTPLIKAARNGHAPVVKLLVENGADPNKTTANNEHTALSLAAYAGHIVIVELLLEFGADPTFKLKDNSTALIEASKNGHTDIVQLLLDFPKFLKQINSEISTSSLAPSLIHERQALKIQQQQHLQHLQQLKQLQTHQQLQQQQLLLLKEKKLFATQQLQQLQLQQKQLLIQHQQQNQQAPILNLQTLTECNKELEAQMLPNPAIVSNICAEYFTGTASIVPFENPLVIHPDDKNINNLLNAHLVENDKDERLELVSDIQKTLSLDENTNESSAITARNESSTKTMQLSITSSQNIDATSINFVDPENVKTPLKSHKNVPLQTVSNYVSLLPHHPNALSSRQNTPTLFNTVNNNVKLVAGPPSFLMSSRVNEGPIGFLPPSLDLDGLPSRAISSFTPSTPSSSHNIANPMTLPCYNLKSLSATKGMALRIGDKIGHLKDLLRNNYSLAHLLGDVDERAAETFHREIRTTDKWAASINGAVRKIERYMASAAAAANANTQKQIQQSGSGDNQQKRLCKGQGLSAKGRQVDSERDKESGDGEEEEEGSQAGDEEEDYDEEQDEEEDDVMVSFTPEQLESRLRSQQAQFDRLRRLQFAKQQQQLHQQRLALQQQQQSINSLDNIIDISEIDEFAASFENLTLQQKQELNQQQNFDPCQLLQLNQFDQQLYHPDSINEFPYFVDPTNETEQHPGDLANLKLSNQSTIVSNKNYQEEFENTDVFSKENHVCCSSVSENVLVSKRDDQHLQVTKGNYLTGTPNFHKSLPCYHHPFINMNQSPDETSVLSHHQQLQFQQLQSQFNNGIITNANIMNRPGGTFHPSFTLPQHLHHFHHHSFTNMESGGPPQLVHPYLSLPNSNNANLSSLNNLLMLHPPMNEMNLTGYPPVNFKNLEYANFLNAAALDLNLEKLDIDAANKNIKKFKKTLIPPPGNMILPSVNDDNLDANIATARTILNDNTMDTKNSQEKLLAIKQETNTLQDDQSLDLLPSQSSQLQSISENKICTSMGGNPLSMIKKYYPAIEVDAQTDSNHDTALTLACAGGPPELVELLIKRGSSIEHRDKKGFTPLIISATSGQANIVQLLLNHGVNIEAQSDRTKDTALSLACSSGRFEVVEVLLNNGAYIEHRNVSDYTPLSLAASGGHCNIIKLLLNHGAEINSRTGSKLGISPLMLAAMNGHLSAVKLLLDMGSDINAQIETNKNTALTLACFQGKHEVVSLFLEYKANIEHRAKTGLTPLMEAASGGFVEVGRVLIEKGADVNAAPVPSSRDTALTIAADKGHIKFVELLVQNGAQIEVKNKKGNSPLWLAANGGHLDVVQYLVQKGADIDTHDNRKVTCLMAAFRKGHIRAIRWLVKHVNQYPSDTECMRFISTLTDKDAVKRCQQCVDIIVSAKDRQAAEANKNASDLLEELDKEKTREENKKAAAARRREKKRMKKKEKSQITTTSPPSLSCPESSFIPNNELQIDALKIVIPYEATVITTDITEKEDIVAAIPQSTSNYDDHSYDIECQDKIISSNISHIPSTIPEKVSRNHKQSISSKYLATTSQKLPKSSTKKTFVSRSTDLPFNPLTLTTIHQSQPAAEQLPEATQITEYDFMNYYYDEGHPIKSASDNDDDDEEQQQWSKATSRASKKTRSGQHLQQHYKDPTAIYLQTPPSSYSRTKGGSHNKTPITISTSTSVTASLKSSHRLHHDYAQSSKTHGIGHRYEDYSPVRSGHRTRDYGNYSTFSLLKWGGGEFVGNHKQQQVSSSSYHQHPTRYYSKKDYESAVDQDYEDLSTTKNNKDISFAKSSLSIGTNNENKVRRLHFGSAANHEDDSYISEETGKLSLSTKHSSNTIVPLNGPSYKYKHKPTNYYSTIYSSGQDDSRVDYSTSHKASNYHFIKGTSSTSHIRGANYHHYTRSQHLSADDSSIGVNNYHKWSSTQQPKSILQGFMSPSFSTSNSHSRRPNTTLSTAFSSTYLSTSSFGSSSPDYTEEEWKEVVRKCKRVVVASNVVARVIGRGGQNINAIRDMSGAHIEIDKQKGAADRNITIKGSSEAIKFAYQLIMALVDEPDRDAMEIIQSYESLKPSSKLPAILQKSNLLSFTNQVMMKSSRYANNPIAFSITTTHSNVPLYSLTTSRKNYLATTLPSHIVTVTSNNMNQSTTLINTSSTKNPVSIISTVGIPMRNDGLMGNIYNKTSSSNGYSGAWGFFSLPSEYSNEDKNNYSYIISSSDPQYVTSLFSDVGTTESYKMTSNDTDNQNSSNIKSNQGNNMYEPSKIVSEGFLKFTSGDDLPLSNEGYNKNIMATMEDIMSFSGDKMSSQTPAEYSPFNTFVNTMFPSTVWCRKDNAVDLFNKNNNITENKMNTESVGKIDSNSFAFKAADFASVVAAPQNNNFSNFIPINKLKDLNVDINNSLAEVDLRKAPGYKRNLLAKSTASPKNVDVESSGTTNPTNGREIITQSSLASNALKEANEHAGLIVDKISDGGLPKLDTANDPSNTKMMPIGNERFLQKETPINPLYNKYTPWSLGTTDAYSFNEWYDQSLQAYSQPSSFMDPKLANEISDDNSRNLFSQPSSFPVDNPSFNNDNKRKKDILKSNFNNFATTSMVVNTNPNNFAKMNTNLAAFDPTDNGSSPRIISSINSNIQLNQMATSCNYQQFFNSAPTYPPHPPPNHPNPFLTNTLANGFPPPFPPPMPFFNDTARDSIKSLHQQPTPSQILAATAYFYNSANNNVNPNKLLLDPSNNNVFANLLDTGANNSLLSKIKNKKQSSTNLFSMPPLQFSTQPKAGQLNFDHHLSNLTSLSSSLLSSYNANLINPNMITSQMNNNSISSCKKDIENTALYNNANFPIGNAFLNEGFRFPIVSMNLDMVGNNHNDANLFSNQGDLSNITYLNNLNAASDQNVNHNEGRFEEDNQGKNSNNKGQSRHLDDSLNNFINNPLFLGANTNNCFNLLNQSFLSSNNPLSSLSNVSNNFPNIDMNNIFNDQFKMAAAVAALASNNTNNNDYGLPNLAPIPPGLIPLGNFTSNASNFDPKLIGWNGWNNNL
ncbi:unnamed protein product [Gordionus sp. m RMFG-2023]